MNEGPESKPGVWASLKRILDTLLATAQNRIELFAVELQEEKCRLVEAILCAAAVMAFGMMTLTLVTFTIVVFFWENGRLPALAIPIGFRPADPAKITSSISVPRSALLDRSPSTHFTASTTLGNACVC